MLIGVAAASSASAQKPAEAAPPPPAVTDPSGPMETRAALEAEARKAEDEHRPGEAWVIRSRLREGDFQEGDKILLKLLGPAQLVGAQPGNDTVTVRAGKMLPLPQLPDLSLDGVLRSELTAKLEAHLGRFLRDSSVKATALIRLAIFGQVRSPGYYYVPTDLLLNDLIMKAGGPGGTADLGNIIIRRGIDVIWTPQDTRTALADGVSLERLGLKAGDEMYVDDVNQGISYTRLLSYAGPVIGVLSFLLSRFFR